MASNRIDETFPSFWVDSDKPEVSSKPTRRSSIVCPVSSCGHKIGLESPMGCNTDRIFWNEYPVFMKLASTPAMDAVTSSDYSAFVVGVYSRRGAGSIFILAIDFP